MDRPPPQRTGRLLRFGLAATALGALVLYNSVDATPAGSSVAAPAVAAPAVAAPPTTAAAKPPAKRGPVLPRSSPTRVRIPQLMVDAPTTELTLNATGQLNAPPVDDKNLVGWYRDGASPGEPGAAVLAGHVDTRTGPAVFLMLRVLLPGNKIEVTRADKKVAVFTVDSVETFEKDAFPDKRVYADTPDAQLRLITCGGSYDRTKKDYTSNVVVFAHLESVR
ncbi:class F sortase [Kitasatospora sp. NPDC048540]|uniref:class F sortase n=1 Tax=unclassified Kitasatospora TaxID=2633591 RepID=UPI00053B1ABD|nr:class F sortase [Kitasatospora sp. MBT63]